MPNNTAGKHRIVIVGAGYGGLVTLTHLQKALKHEQSVEIVLLNPAPYQESRAEMDLVAHLAVPVDFCKIEFQEFIDPQMSRFIEGTMIGLNVKNNLIYYRPGNLDPYKDDAEAELKALSYSQLVLACGAAPALPPVDGLKDHVHIMWTLNELESFKCKVVRNIKKAAALIEACKNSGQEVTEAEVQEVNQLLTISVVGAGASGVEIMVPLATSAQEYAQDLGISPSLLNFQLFDGLAAPVAEFSSNIQEKAHRVLKNARINTILGSFVNKVDEESIYLQNGEVYPKGALAYAGGARAHKRTDEWGLSQSRSGRIEVDPTMQVKSHPGIWALGDIASYEVAGEKIPELPMLAQHAMRQADIVVHNVCASYRSIANEQNITEEVGKFSEYNQQLKAGFKSYHSALHGQFVSVGEDCALGWAGEKSFEFGGKAALLMKRMTYLLYWVTMGGVAFGKNRMKKMLKIHSN